MKLHPLETTRTLRASYERYLKTIYPFQDRQLRDLYWQALATPDRLVKGPMLEASPPYEPGQSLGDLVAAGVLSPGFRELCATTTALPVDRPLYVHQERAIRNVVAGRNLIVATGTGSGKTESFLIPILDALLREREAGTLAEPGVRALLLYPMNALANDQLERLRALLGHFPEITYGRYTGETLYGQPEAEDAFRTREHADPPPNEVISRDGLRTAPPHILLTNYAMLEYLLLRPQDTELFDGELGRHWRFIVVDEAHVYDGASGIEVGMLLRRLKDRVSAGRSLTCIATSATLGRGVEDFPAAAAFGQELFGEPFAAADVFAAVRRRPDALGDEWGEGDPALYTDLRQLGPAATPGDAAAVAARWGVAGWACAAAASAADLPAALYAILRGDSRVRRLQAALDQPQLLEEVAGQVFDLPEAQAQEAIIDLVDLAVKARPDGDALPLLPARYHVFARAMEGAFACLNAAAPAHGAGRAHGDGRARLYLNRHETCPECQSAIFELATCTRCGAAYVVGDLEDDKVGDERVHRLVPGKSSFASSETAYFLLQDEAVAEANEDELAEDEGVEALDQQEWAAWSLCLACGMAVEGRRPTPCDCGRTQRTIYRYVGKRTDRMVCGKCQTRSSGAVYRLLTGQDAPVSVLVTQLYSQLPASDDPDMAIQPGQGRKLLIFADSRQDAAFLAPYLERTGRNILYRRLILQALLDDPNAREGTCRLEDLAGILAQRTRGMGILDPDASPMSRKTETGKWLIRELTNGSHMQGLEGLGLLHFRHIREAEEWLLPAPLLEPPWNLTADEAKGLILELLDSARRHGDMTFPEGVDPGDDFFVPRNRPYYLLRVLPENTKGAKRVALQGWSPRRGSNTRANFLEKLLAHTAPELGHQERRDVALETLAKLWDFMQSGPFATSWVSEMLPTVGMAYQLKHDHWEWQATDDTTKLWQCDHCRRLTFRSLHGVCATYACEGTLVPVQLRNLQGTNQHYRYLYRQLPPAFLTVEEHTAQWSAEKAAEVQKKFIDGEVNILSCSTTFELGVDVGTLNAVVMRNMPPTTANYVQRAGRAGRRRDSAAFVLTYAQRRSHDLAHYQHPESMVAGHVRPPMIAIRNPEIVRRHMASVLIAAFLRWCVDEKCRFRNRQEMRVGEFFRPSEGPSGPELLAEYVQTRPEAVRQALLRIVPDSLHEELHVADWQWLEELVCEDQSGSFDQVALQVGADIDLYFDLIQKAAAERNFGRAGYYQSVEKTIRDRDLINELSRQGVLPKYGFPVDVVPMLTDHVQLPIARDVDLQRDLRVGLSEFAPGNQIVAAKTVWTSGGLNKMPQRDWETANFGVCKHCGRFNAAKGDEKPTTCRGCGRPLQSTPGKQGKLVKPEFGFVAQPMKHPPAPGETRPPRSYTSQVYFDHREVPAHFVPEESAHWPDFRPIPELSSPSLMLSNRYSHYGRLVVLNHGQKGGGFEICHTCGFGQPATLAKAKRKTAAPAKHVNPRTGRECSGRLYNYHLGHDFITDVLELQLDGPGARAAVAFGEKDRWRSVLYALLEGASQALQIRRTDLNGTLYYTAGSDVPVLVLYDDVPGGAGHVRRVAEAWPAVFQQAYERVAHCGCGPETACHECLWNYYNQPFHDTLSRGLAADFLGAVIGLPGE